MLFIVLTVLCLPGCLLSLPDTSRLRMVHLMYRHGDRTPCHFYPTDPYKDPSEWPVGAGQLTNRGKRMCFELGKWIKRNYEGFLSDDYCEDEIYVRSSDVDRTLMSAQLVLAGLYPPDGDSTWSEDLHWQPIPVHTVPEEYDIMLADHKPCPRIVQLENEVRESSYMKDIVYNANKDLFEYISTHTGWNITTTEQLTAVYNELFIESSYNKTLPEWTASVFPGGKFNQLSQLSFIHDTFNEELKKLKAGPFLNEVLSHYSDYAASHTRLTPHQKVHMYSAHDISITRVLNALGVYDGPSPPYASTVIFELLDQDGLKVSISYRNDTTREPFNLTIPGCDNLCPLEMFRELTEGVRTEDWEEECENKLEENLK